MEQFTQKLRDGSIRILEVPLPVAAPGMVLVQNHYSLVSAGTEGSPVRTARKSLIGKARGSGPSRPNRCWTCLNLRGRCRPTVFIASRHNSEYVQRALEAGKHVFVEKPLCLTVEELHEIRRRMSGVGPSQGSGVSLRPGGGSGVGWKRQRA